MVQTGKVANPDRGQLNRESELCPSPLSAIVSHGVAVIGFKRFVCER